MVDERARPATPTSTKENETDMRNQAARIGTLAVAALGALVVVATGTAAVSSVSSKGTSSDLSDCAAAAAAEGWSGSWTGIKVDQPDKSRPAGAWLGL